MLLVTSSIATARPARVEGNRILDGSNQPLKVRGITWGGSQFVPVSARDPLPLANLQGAAVAMRRISGLGANLVRVNVSSAADNPADRRALQRLQRLARSRGMILLLANTPLSEDDQTQWLTTLSGWFKGQDNVWYLAETDPDCGTFTISTRCGDTEAWIWSQSQNIRSLRRAGVRTPIVINLPSGSRSVSLNWSAALGDTNLIYGVHPPAGGQRRFSQRAANAMTLSLEAATRRVPVLFDRIGRIQTMVELRDGDGNRPIRSTRDVTDTLHWSEGLLAWVTGWTIIDGGDGAIVSGWDTANRDNFSGGRKRLTAWGRNAAAGFFALSFRAQAGRDPGSNFSGAFQLGDRGGDVRQLQADLARLGYLKEEFVSGLYDDATWQAIVAFQGYTRIERTGVANALTRVYLMRAERPQAAQPDAGRHLEIDIQRQILMLVRADGAVLRVIHISSGSAGNTPVGRYTVLRRERMSWSVPFKAFLPYASYFFEGFAIHEWADVPVYPASHGCVRVPSYDSATVFDFSEIGMPVLVTNQ